MLKRKYKLYVSIILLGLSGFTGIYGISKNCNFANAEGISANQVKNEENDIIEPYMEEITVVGDYIVETRGWATDSKEESQKLMDRLQKEMQSQNAEVHTICGDNISEEK